MMKLSAVCSLLLSLQNGDAFAPRHSPVGFSSTGLARVGKSYGSPLIRLNVGIQADPEEWMAQDSSITPEGFGFSSSIDRVLKSADRSGGYYRASSSDIVTDVMEGITNGKADVALVFDDVSNKLAGIFTETDYIKVRAPLVQPTKKRIRSFLTSVMSFSLLQIVFNATRKIIKDRRGISQVPCVTRQGIHHSYE